MKTEKAIVLKPFYDVLTEKDYKPGDVMADLLPLRREYLVNAGLVKAVEIHSPVAGGARPGSVLDRAAHAAAISDPDLDKPEQDALIPEAVIKAASKRPGPRVKK